MSSKLFKEFKPSSWAIENKVVIYLLIFIGFFAGIAAYYDMPRESFPEIKETKVYISTVYPGNTSEDIEKLITTPLENALKNLSNVDKITSTSQEDYSIITVQFDENISIFEANLRVKDKVDNEKTKDDWPIYNNSKVEPNIFDINISEQIPIFNINLQGDYPAYKLKDYAEYLKDNIERFPEIKEVAISGAQEKEVEVAVDIYKMTAAKVSFDNIINTIRSGNTTISGGNIVISGERKMLRMIGEIEKPEDLSNFVVKSEGRQPIYLKDIATIKFKDAEKTTFARSYGENVVLLDIKKLAGKNMIDVTKKIKQFLDDAIKNVFPKDLKVFITNDQSELTVNSVNDLVNNIIFGVLLVVVVLMFFLNLRNALFVGFAIPMSMLISYFVLDTLGYTLNTMVLFALVMGLGMLVDNGIVLIENIYRLVSKEKMNLIEASKMGVGEIAYPIIISTATTVAAFVPLGFWPGVMGQFMIYFPITLSVVLGSSLFVALFFNSVLVSRLMQESGKDSTFNAKKLIKKTYTYGGVGLVLIFVPPLRFIGTLLLVGLLLAWCYNLWIIKAVSYFQSKILIRFELFYERAIRVALKNKNPQKFLFSTIGLLIFAIFLFGIFTPKVGFFPDNKPRQIMVYAEYPVGTDIHKTNKIIYDIEDKVYKILNDKKFFYNGENFMVQSAISQVGEGAGNPNVDGASSSEMPHKGKITVLLSEFKFRRGEDSELLRQRIQEELLGKYPGLKISVEKDANGPPVGFPINIELTGYDYKYLINEGKRLIKFINAQKIQGIEGLAVNVNMDKPMTEIIPNREKAGELGVSASQIGVQIRRALFGEKAGTFKYKEDDYDINVRFKKDNRYDMNALLNQNILFRDPSSGRLKEVPVTTVTKTKNSYTFNSIKHINSERVVTVYSGLLPGYNASEVVSKIEKELKNYDRSEGVIYKFTGEIEEQGKQFAFLVKALLSAIALILLLLVLQFNSISKPMIILLAIVLSFIGVLMGLVIFQMPFIIILTMLGIISLAGIIVNNGVVLLDYTQILIDRKRAKLNLNSDESLPLSDIKEAIIFGGSTRLKPVLLTAITTILGLIPLAVGLNIDFFSLISDWDPRIYIGGDNVIFWGPLAWTVIYGLIFATFLTLVIIPVAFYISILMKIKRKMVV